MALMPPFAIIPLILILARASTGLWLSRLNQRHVRAHASEVPAAFRGIIDEAMYHRSIDYTLAKSRFGDITVVFDAVVLIAVLFSGVLPWAFGIFSASFGTSTYVVVVISPETTQIPVVTRTSQATRPVGSADRTASSTASEIWSAILSG